MHQGDCGE
jgi:hypothetical protein